MAGGLNRGRQRRKLNAEVNIINLVDVVLVLLIIFMVTAPMMQSGIDVRLPKAVAQPLNATSHDLLVQGLADGGIKVNGRVLTLREFEDELPRLISAGNVTKIVYAGDGKLNNDGQAPIIAAISKAGLPIGWIFDPRVKR